MDLVNQIMDIQECEFKVRQVIKTYNLELSQGESLETFFRNFIHSKMAQLQFQSEFRIKKKEHRLRKWHGKSPGFVRPDLNFKINL
jgi:hypothetical protein